MPILAKNKNCQNLGEIKRIRLGLVSDLSDTGFQTMPSQDITFKAGLGYLFDMKRKDFKFSDLELTQENESGVFNDVSFSIQISNDLLASNFDPTYRRLEGRLLVAEITSMNENVATFAPLLSNYKYNQGSASESPYYEFSFRKTNSIRFIDYIFPKLSAKIILNVTSEKITSTTFRALVQGINAFSILPLSTHYEVGFSLLNDIDTVTDWFTTVESGKLIIPTVQNNTQIFVFVRQTDNHSVFDTMPHYIDIQQYRLESKIISLENTKPNAEDLLEFDGSNTVS